MRPLAHAATAAAVLGALSTPLLAQQGRSAAPATGAQRVEVCKLLPKEEVKKHLPWMDALDQLPINEAPVGASGSSCDYPTVRVQVLPFSQSVLEAVRQAGPLESISGIGDEAYFRNNRDRYAELVVKVGARLVTLQANADKGIDVVKPNVIELAKVYVARLR